MTAPRSVDVCSEPELISPEWITAALKPNAVTTCSPPWLSATAAKHSTLALIA